MTTPTDTPTPSARDERLEQMARCVAHQLDSEFQDTCPGCRKRMDIIMDALATARAEELRRVILALHPTCASECAMDNGRVWAFCGAQWLLKDGASFTEEELHAIIRALPTRRAEEESGRG